MDETDVWVFNRTDAAPTFPCAVFSSRKLAHEWIAEKQPKGILTKYVLNTPDDPTFPEHYYFETAEDYIWFETLPERDLSMDELGRGAKPAYVDEQERQSKKEVGESRKYSWNIPIGMYREIEHIAKTEGVPFPRALQRLCRRGIQAWRGERGMVERDDS